MAFIVNMHTHRCGLNKIKCHRHVPRKLALVINQLPSENGPRSSSVNTAVHAWRGKKGKYMTRLVGQPHARVGLTNKNWVLLLSLSVTSADHHKWKPSFPQLGPSQSHYEPQFVTPSSFSRPREERLKLGIWPKCRRWPNLHHQFGPMMPHTHTTTFGGEEEEDFLLWLLPSKQKRLPFITEFALTTTESGPIC